MDAWEFADRGWLMDWCARQFGGDPVDMAGTEDDWKRVCDIKCNNVSIAVRMRRERCLRWADEFTLRVPHEKEKILQRGLGDYMLYGFANSEKRVVRMSLIDFKGLRARSAERMLLPCAQKTAPDGKRFEVFKLHPSFSRVVIG
jgi:hypothetical protein